MLPSMMQGAASMHLSSVCAPCKQQGKISSLLCFVLELSLEGLGLKVVSWSVAFKAKKQFFEKGRMKAGLLKSNESFACERKHGSLLWKRRNKLLFWKEDESSRRRPKKVLISKRQKKIAFREKQRKLFLEERKESLSFAAWEGSFSFEAGKRDSLFYRVHGGSMSFCALDFSSWRCFGGGHGGSMSFLAVSPTSISYDFTSWLCFTARAMEVVWIFVPSSFHGSLVSAEATEVVWSFVLSSFHLDVALARATEVVWVFVLSTFHLDLVSPGATEVVWVFLLSPPRVSATTLHLDFALPPGPWR